MAKNKRVNICYICDIPPLICPVNWTKNWTFTLILLQECNIFTLVL